MLQKWPYLAKEWIEVLKSPVDDCNLQEYDFYIFCHHIQSKTHNDNVIGGHDIGMFNISFQSALSNYNTG